MALTRDFRDTVMAMAKEDPEYRCALIQEAIEVFLERDFETGKHLLRDYLNATETFPELAKAVHKDVKSLRRMLGSKGNPTANNLFQVIYFCRAQEGMTAST